MAADPAVNRSVRTFLRGMSDGLGRTRKSRRQAIRGRPLKVSQRCRLVLGIWRFDQEFKALRPRLRLRITPPPSGRRLSIRHPAPRQRPVMNFVETGGFPNARRPRLPRPRALECRLAGGA